MSYPDTSLASCLGGLIPGKNEMDGFVASATATEVVPTLCLQRTASADATDERRRRDAIGQLIDDLQIILGVHVGQGLLLFLLTIARYARCPCSVALIGPSSVGKTTVATRIAATQPVEDVKCLTHVTHAALAAGLGVTPTYDSAGNRMIDLARNYFFCMKMRRSETATSCRVCGRSPARRLFLGCRLRLTALYGSLHVVGSPCRPAMDSGNSGVHE